MRTRLLVCVLVCWTAGALAQEKAAPPAGEAKPGVPATQPAAKPQITAATAASPLDFTMADSDGKDVDLARNKGQVVLIVNVASKCGFTPQYKDLQAVYDKYRERGLRILAFPANNFREQEPGTNKEIKLFCQEKYGVTFDVFAKISVKGADQAELYKFLTSAEKNPGFGGEIAWNFTKFLVGRDGKVVARFEPKVKPDDPEAIKAIEQALDQKAPAGAQTPPAAETGKTTGGPKPPAP